VRIRGRAVYYGWLQVVVLGITETTSWGILYYAYSVLVVPMQAELGWSRSALTGAFSLALVVSALAAVPVGRWIDRHGARALMTVGSALSALLLLAWAAVGDLPTFYALWALIGVAQAMVLYEPSFAVVAAWFQRRRGQALTVLTTMAGFASTIFLPLTAWLVDAQGWRGALVTLAVLLAVVTVPLHALALRRRPEDMGLRPDGAQPEATNALAATLEPAVGVAAALRGREFWWLAGAFSLGALVLIGQNVHFVPYLVGAGYDPGLAAAAAGLVGAMKAPARVVFGPLSDRLSVRALTALLFGLQTLALSVLLLVPGQPGVFAFAIVFGAAAGAMTTARPALLAEIYGRASYATISGAMTASGVVARALAPLGIGAAYDLLGTYVPVWWALAALGLLGAAAVLVAGRGRPAPAVEPAVPAGLAAP
jgi:MFS family permease